MSRGSQTKHFGSLDTVPSTDAVVKLNWIHYVLEMGGVKNMSRKLYLVCLFALVLSMFLLLTLSVSAQGQKVAVFIQPATAVPASDAQQLSLYANRRAKVITGNEVCSIGEVMDAQRSTGTYVGDRMSVQGMRRLAQTLAVDHLIVLRIVRWDDEMSFKPERALLVLAAASLVGSSIRVLASPLGLLFGLEKEPTVGLLATVYNAAGDVEFSTGVVCKDDPPLSLLNADIVNAAKKAVNEALYQVAVTF